MCRIKIGSQWWRPLDLAECGFEDEERQQLAALCRDWLDGRPSFRLQTSGSTGTPQGIEFRREQLVRSARMTQNAFGLQRGDILLLNLPLRYVAGFMMVVRALALELDLVVLPPQGLAESPADDAVTLAAFVPHQLQQLLEAQAPLLSALRAAKAVLVGGAPLSAPQERQLSAVDFPLYHTYGMTETLTHVALRRLNASQRQDAYTALPGVRFEQDERACLIVHSPVVDAPVATRDRVELLGPTRFRYLGRIDNVVVSGGIKIQLERTEVQLRPVLELFFPGQALPRFFLHPQPDERLGQVLVLYVEMPEGAFPRDAVLAKARAELPPYHAPRRVAVLRRFLYTESGKIRRATTAESS